MAITSSERADILALVALMFDAAPGASYLADITAAYESAGHNLQELARLLADSPVFGAVHPNFETASEFATKMLSTVGLQNDAAARDWVISQFNAGATKGAILYAAWDLLAHLPESYAPQYQAAAAALANKATVSEYYSVVLHESSTSVAALQNVLRGVTADAATVDAAIDALSNSAAQGPVLTPGLDNVQVLGTASTVVSGLVDGDADGNTASGTFNAGDRIRGNGATELELTVIEGGNTGFVRVENVNLISLVAGTDTAVRFNAGGWEGVGSVRLDDGVDGLDVFIDRLKPGTDIAIADVTGSIGADYRLNGGDLVATIRNDDEGGAGGLFHLGTDGKVDAQLASEVSAQITGTNVILGDVNVQGADDSAIALRFNGAKATLGNVNVAAGSDASVQMLFDEVDGNVTAGNISLVAGADSLVSLGLDEPDGDVSTGHLSLTAGDDSDVVLFASATQNAGFGNITLAAGEDSGVSASFVADGEDSVLVAGNASLSAGDGSDISFAAQQYASVTLGGVALQGGDGTTGLVRILDVADNVVAGGVTVSLGDASNATVIVQDSGSVAVGNVQLQVGEEGAATVAITSNTGDLELGNVAEFVGSAGTAVLVVANEGNAHIGNVQQHGDDEAMLYGNVSVVGDLADLSVAGYEAQAGDDSGVNLAISHMGAKLGSTTVGDVGAALGNNSAVNIFITAAGTDAPTEESPEPTAGDFSVGNITASVGDVPDIDGAGSVTVALLYGSKAEGGEIGDFGVGDVHLSVGNGYVSGTAEARATANMVAAAVSLGEVGDAHFGDATLEGGDFATLNLGFGGAVVGQAGTSIGDATVGNLSLSGGEAAQINALVGWGAQRADSVGSLSVGDVDVHGKQDSAVNLYLVHGAVSGTVESVGDFSVGNVSAVLGDNSDVRLTVWERAAFGGLETDANGDFVFGDIDIAVSATETEDLSGGSTIAVDVRRQLLGLDEIDAGVLTLGDVSLSAGHDSSVAFNLEYSAAAKAIGDVSIGTVALSVGDDGTAASAILVRNTVGDIGAVRLEGQSLSLGDGAEGMSTLVIDKNGSDAAIGPVALGDITLDLGKEAQAAVSLVLAGTTGTEAIGGLSIGNVSVDAGDGSQAALTGFHIEAQSIGDVLVGSFTVLAGEDVNVQFGVDIDVTKTAGKVTTGDITITADQGTTVGYGLDVAAGTTVGAVSLGNVSVSLQAGAHADITGAHIAGTKIGGSTIGNATLAVTDGASAVVSYQLTAGDIGNTVVGDVHLSVADGGALTDDTPDAVAAGGSLQYDVIALGDANDDLTVGDITIQVAGTAADDEVLIHLATNGDIVIGNLTVSGKGLFSFDAADEAADNTSVLAITAAGTKTIGDVDFSGYAGNANLDLSWTTAGAGHITGGSGNDAIKGNAGANVIAGGKGVDVIDISQGGNDTIVTSQGDSGKTAPTIDTIIGFNAGTVVSGALSGGDKLDFNLVAGTAGNYVERAEDFASFAQFVQNANDALNSTVKYFVQDDGTDTYVAVNFGSGEADLIIRLAGVNDATSLQYQNFIA